MRKKKFARAKTFFCSFYHLHRNQNSFKITSVSNLTFRFISGRREDTSLWAAACGVKTNPGLFCAQSVPGRGEAALYCGGRGYREGHVCVK